MHCCCTYLTLSVLKDLACAAMVATRELQHCNSGLER